MNISFCLMLDTYWKYHLEILGAIANSYIFSITYFKQNSYPFSIMLSCFIVSPNILYNGWIIVCHTCIKNSSIFLFLAINISIISLWITETLHEPQRWPWSFLFHHGMSLQVQRSGIQEAVISILQHHLVFSI